MICNFTTPPEKYSSYKNRKFNEFDQKINRITAGVRAISLKPEDKVKLLKKMIKHLEDERRRPQQRYGG